MNRKEMAALGILIVTLLTWPIVAPKIEQQFFPVQPIPESVPSDAEVDPAKETAPRVIREQGAEMESPVAVVQTLTPESGVETAPGSDLEQDYPDDTVKLHNDVMDITLSSRGGSVTEILLKEYRETLDKESPEVVLNFSPHGGLVYTGLPGIAADQNLKIKFGATDRAVHLSGVLHNGLSFDRSVELGEQYVLRIVDTFQNQTRDPVDLPEHALQLGSMKENGDGSAPKGMYYLGIDALLHGGKGVEYYGKKILPKALKNSPDLQVEVDQVEPVDWLAVKNRYFTQILRPNDDSKGIQLLGAKLSRDKPMVSDVAGRIMFPSYILGPDQTFSRTSEYYVGPKKFSIIRESSRHQTEVMEFGFFSPICKFLLWVLNFIHDKMWPHNYGIAIMLLTVIIRTIFWPITHKGTENMRKMQEIAPLMKEVKEKYKDKPDQQQKAMMELYKENKVNPVGGCLPMVIQIPIFFSLFVVLRSAIEMRFAGFLWIQDLSEPENLFKGLLPFGLGLNILPFLNAGSMFLQQKLTPTTGDANQQKIMQFMPLMMLVLFYNFASGLVLYWTTNQVLMMTQQVMYYRRREAGEKAEKD